MKPTEQQVDRTPKRPWVTPAMDVIALKDALSGQQSSFDGSFAGYS